MTKYNRRTLQVLRRASRGEPTLSDLLTAFLSAGYGASPKRIEYMAARYAGQRVRQDDKVMARRLCTDTIYRLKRDGLLESTHNPANNTKRGLGFRITTLGRKLLAALGQEPHRPILPPPHYDPTGPDKFVVVAFDVPEKERWKRRWLRSVLANLNLRLVQRSVWAGKAAIPKQFIQDLAALNLLEAVEIFEITKTGTLRHLI